MARILIVDDSEMFAEFTRAVLASDHEVDVVHNGRQAATLALRNPYDLIITDIFMPVADGYETIRSMRRDLPKVPVIAMSGSEAGTPDFLAIAAKLGATRTIRKPFAASELTRLVAATLAGSATPNAA